MEHIGILSALALVFAGLMAWGIGANDVANAMGTSVGAKALSIKQAVIIAAVFELTGAVVAGSEVTATVRKGMVQPDAFAGSPETLVFGMLAALLGAFFWLLIATYRGWPVSTTHTIVGSIIGFTIITVGTEAVAWDKVRLIAYSWVLSPLIAAAIAFAVVKSIRTWIVDSDTPVESACKLTPFYLATTFFILALLLFAKGLKYVDWINDLSTASCYGIAFIVAVLAGLLGWYLTKGIRQAPFEKKADEHRIVESIFASLMVITACAMAFAHGSNDVANAIGPAVAVLSTLESQSVQSSASVQPWILLLGGVGIVVGLITYGKRVMVTVGEKITQITPYQGFSAEIAASSTVVFASTNGIPISTSHALVGAVLGVGLSKGLSNIDGRVVLNIFLSWLVTLPVGALFCVIIYYILRYFFAM
ncbi:MAG: inorganic phosphate transporter [Gammaproteobacteria bacterium]